MFNFLHRNTTDENSILDDIRFRPRDIEDKFKNNEIKEGTRVNYLRILHAKSAKIALAFSIFSLLLSYIAIRITIFLKGNPELYISAIVFSAIAFAVYSLYFVYKGLKEKNRKYILNYISLLLSGTELILWIIIMIVGIR